MSQDIRIPNHSFSHSPVVLVKSVISFCTILINLESSISILLRSRKLLWIWRRTKINILDSATVLLAKIIFIFWNALLSKREKQKQPWIFFYIQSFYIEIYYLERNRASEFFSWIAICQSEKFSECLRI